MDDKQERIRRRAHAIWEREGRPTGRDGEHWELAAREIEAEETDPTAQPSGLASSLQRGGTKPDGGPGAGGGSIGAGGGSTAKRPTGSPKRTATKKPKTGPSVPTQGD